jgi:diacylglycerol kinase (ATP)
MLALAVVLIPVALMLDVSPAERALMVAVLMLGLVVELINSAIEAAIDRISLELHPLSKNAKDMGSAAQMITLALIILVWLIILLS